MEKNMFKLINELQEMVIVEQFPVSEKQEILMERVDKLLGHLHAVLSNKTDPLNGENAEELSWQLAGLQLLGKKDNRDSMDDFAKIDTKGVSKNFFKFLDQVDDPRQTKDFSERRSADELLKYIATTHAASIVADWKKTIEAAQSGDANALERIKTAVAKLWDWYQGQYNAMKSHLKVGGSFDDIVPAKTDGPEVEPPKV
jgi:hypothetical protein